MPKDFPELCLRPYKGFGKYLKVLSYVVLGARGGIRHEGLIKLHFCHHPLGPSPK